MKTSAKSTYIFLSIIALAVLSFTFYSFNSNPDTKDAYVGEWKLATDSYPPSDVAKPIVSGAILRIKKYGAQYTVELDTENEANQYLKATIPAVFKENMLFIYGEKGSMPAILNSDQSRLFYFAEFKKVK